jgi:hypothetical protein
MVPTVIACTWSFTDRSPTTVSSTALRPARAISTARLAASATEGARSAAWREVSATSLTVLTVCATAAACCCAAAACAVVPARSSAAAAEMPFAVSATPARSVSMRTLAAFSSPRR